MSDNNDRCTDGSDRSTSFDYDIDPDEIEVHWQHPRTEIETPVLLVWPMAVRDSWAAEVDGGVAWVVCHTTLYEDQEGEVQKVSRKVHPNEPIPWCVSEALLRYDSEYGPVETVANPYTDEGEKYKNELVPQNQATLSHVPDGGTSDIATTGSERSGGSP